MTTRARLLATVLGATLLPALAIGAIAGLALSDARRDARRELAARAALSDAELLRARLDGLAAQLPLLPAEEAPLARAADAAGVWAVVLEGGGGEVAHLDERRLGAAGYTARSYLDRIHADRPRLWAAARGGGIAVLPVDRGGRPALALAQLRGEEERLRIAELSPALLELSPGAGTVHLVDADGRELWSSGPPLELAALPPLRAALAAGVEAGAFHHGGASIGGFAAVGRGGLRVVRLAPEETALAALAPHEPLLLLAAGVLLVAALFAAAATLGGLRPLEELARAASRIAGGDIFGKLPALAGEAGAAAKAIGALQAKVGQREEELHRQNALLVDASRRAAVGELTIGIAGGVRAPLAGVRSYAQVGLASAEGDARMLFEEIDGQAGKAAGLLDELLAVAGGAGTGTSSLDLGHAVDEALRLAEAPLQLADARLERDALAEAKVKADPVELRQILLWLLLSAARRTPRGGTFKLVAGARNDGRAVVIVEDPGPALAAEDLYGLLEPRRVGRVQVDGGTLAVARMLARKGGGELVAASAGGKGLKLTLELPLLRAEAAPPTAPVAGVGT